MPILEVRDVSYTYSAGTPYEKTALDHVSLSVGRGEFIGVIGHTGSGKSTLMQHLNGLLRPDGGTIRLNGKDIWENPKKIRSVRFQVGLVFQYPEYQLFEETVRRDIAFGPRNMGLSDAEIARRVSRAAEMVGIPQSLLETSPFDLSGGQKRRVAIAGVMAMQPDILVLDEPTAGLDPEGRESLLSHIDRYRRENGATVLLVSHSMEDVARMADKVLVMHQGKVQMFGSVSEVFSRARELEAEGLSVPAVTRIFMALREKGYDVGENVYTVEQAVERLLPLLRGGEKGAQ